MLPILLDLKIIKIYTFGVFLVLAFFWGTFWLWRNVKLTSYKEEDIFDGLFVSLFGALFTARLFYVLLNINEFGLNFLKFILINGYPGLSLIGGFFGGFLTMFLYTRYKRIPFMHIVDYTISSLFLALAIGKLGSFFAGTELGVQTDFFLHMRYVGAEGTRHLVALYESILLFVGFYLSHSIMFHVRRESVQRGLSFFFFIAYFSLTQLLLDFMKQNHLYLAGLSFNMVVSAVVCGLATIYIAIQYRQSIIATTKNFTVHIKNHGKNWTNKTGTHDSQESTSTRGKEDPGSNEESSS